MLEYVREDKQTTFGRQLRVLFDGRTYAWKCGFGESRLVAASLCEQEEAIRVQRRSADEWKDLELLLAEAEQMSVEADVSTVAGPAMASHFGEG